MAPHRSGNMVVPSRRMMIVLVALIGAMTLSSGLLLVLLPGPIAPSGGIRLSSVDTTVQPEILLFGATPKTETWRLIRIHFSGRPRGSARTLNQLHERLGYGGLLYHFVINNGVGGPEGQIEVGFRWRWRHQLHAQASADLDPVIHICLIGDPSVEPPTEGQQRELVWLVNQLQRHYAIPAHDVQVAEPQPVLFPLAWFRQQLRL